MLEYLKKAFWAGPDVPGLGRLPVNALAVVGLGIFGFVHPAFWLLGAGLEAAYLASVASHPRFQRLIDAQRRQLAAVDATQGRQELVNKLDAGSRKRLALVEEKSFRILSLVRESRAGSFELESQRDALDRMVWIYLKLLVARHHLEASRVHASEADLKRRIDGLAAEMAADLAATAPTSLRESRGATLRLLQQRLSNVERFDQTLKQVDSDLARIEAQVDLALENAGLRGSGAAGAVTANLEVAGQALDEGLYFGDSETAVLALDQAYGTPPPGTRERS